MMRDHRCAGARRHDDVLRVAKDVEKMLRDFGGFFGVSAVECGLSAARLFGWKINVAAGSPQHFGHCKSDIWEDLIYDAGDEQ